MHPFYGPSNRLMSASDDRASGLISMAAYLAFWAAALVLAKREVDARWPRRPGGDGASDPAITVVRDRFARGDIDESQFRAMVRVLRDPDGQP